MTISEPDWRVFKQVQPLALDRLCHRILDESRAVCDDESLSAHGRYLKLYELIHKRDKDIQRAFDEFSRTTAIACLTTMRQLGLVTESELGRFSDDTLYWVMRDD